MVEYPGYGEAPGKPEIEAAHRTMVAAIDAATTDIPPIGGIDPDRVVVFGQSLGGAVSIVSLWESKTTRVRALATEGAFSDYRRIAQEKLGASWLTWPFQVPMSWTVTDRYHPVDAMKEMRGRPVLIIHSDNDPVIPQSHGGRLFGAAAEPKEYWRPHTGHVGALQTLEWQVAFARWIDKVCAKRQAPPLAVDVAAPAAP
jgi:fermentation-respiration switch protein FrsA (DUF1100 family)